MFFFNFFELPYFLDVDIQDKCDATEVSIRTSDKLHSFSILIYFKFIVVDEIESSLQLQILYPVLLHKMFSLPSPAQRYPLLCQEPRQQDYLLLQITSLNLWPQLHSLQSCYNRKVLEKFIILYM